MNRVSFRWLAVVAACTLFTAGAAAQSSDVVTVTEPAKLTLKRGETAPLSLKIQVRSGFHVNSNTPSEDYLIPLRLTWDNKTLTAAKINYPKPEMVKFSFTEKPISVYTGEFGVETQLQAAANAPLGPGQAIASLRYQACNDRMCLPPKTIQVRLTVLVK